MSAETVKKWECRDCDKPLKGGFVQGEAVLCANCITRQIERGQDFSDVELAVTLLRHATQKGHRPTKAELHAVTHVLRRVHHRWRERSPERKPI